MSMVDRIGFEERLRRMESDPWLRFKRRWIYPFRWFYERNLWCFSFRLHCVRVFASAVWHFDTCDYAPTLRLMAIAFREMSKHHTEHPIIMDSKRVARQTMVASELCRRIESDDYGALTKPRDYEHAEYLVKQDIEYLGKTLKYIRHWWS